MVTVISSLEVVFFLCIMTGDDSLCLPEARGRENICDRINSISLVLDRVRPNEW